MDLGTIPVSILLSAETIENSHWLRRARNEIAAHPPLVGMIFDVKKTMPLQMKKDDEVIWANKTMLRDFQKLLNFLEPNSRKQIEETKHGYSIAEGKIVEESIKELIRQKRFDFFNLVLWSGMEKSLTEQIALNSFQKMGNILNSLQIKPTK